MRDFSLKIDYKIRIKLFIFYKMEDILKKEKKVSESDAKIECSICLEKPQNPVFCANGLYKHPVCRECIEKWAQTVSSVNFTCPLCRTLYDYSVKSLFYTYSQMYANIDLFPIMININNSNENEAIDWLNEIFPNSIQETDDFYQMVQNMNFEDYCDDMIPLSPISETRIT